MTNNNRTTAIIQLIERQRYFNNIFFDISANSSEMITKSSTILFMYLHFFRYSKILQSPSQLHAHALGFQAKPFSHTRCPIIVCNYASSSRFFILFWIAFYTIEFTLTQICFINVFDSFLNHINFVHLCIFLLGKHISPNGSSIVLHSIYVYHITSFYINPQLLVKTLLRLNPVTVDLTVYDWLFIDTHFVATNLPKPSSTRTIKAYLINTIV